MTQRRAALRHPVLVTGASTGIGRATVAALADLGVRVWASVRRDEDAAALAAEYGAHVTPLLMDITDEKAVRQAAEQVIAAGPLAGLVCNAGVAVPAPLEYLPLDDLRHQLEVNLIGQVCVTQAMLPAVRAGSGRLVYLGSIGDRITGPLLGAYAASKFGLLGLTDALRAELNPFGIPVILIEPGAVATPIWGRGGQAGERILAQLPTEARAKYANVIEKVSASAQRSARRGAPPASVADVIVAALTVGNPRQRYLVGRDARAMSVIATLPPRVRYRIIARF